MTNRIDAARLAVQSTLIPESDGLVEKPEEWWIEMIAIPKSANSGASLRGRPTYRRGGWTFGLKPGMSFLSVPFTRKDGRPAVGLVLRGSDEDFFAGWFDAARADEVERIASHLNVEIEREVMRHGGVTGESITLEIGNENAPDSPNGCESITITPSGGVEYEQRNRGAVRTASGRASAELWSAASNALSKTSFPRPAQESFLPGGSMMRLTVQGERPGQILLDYYDALEMDGYGELARMLAGICSGLRAGDDVELARWHVERAE